MRRVKVTYVIYRHIISDLKELGQCSSFNWCLCLFCQGTLPDTNQTCNNKRHTHKLAQNRITQTHCELLRLLQKHTPTDGQTHTHTLPQLAHIIHTLIARSPCFFLPVPWMELVRIIIQGSWQQEMELDCRRGHSGSRAGVWLWTLGSWKKKSHCGGALHQRLAATYHQLS